MRVLLIFPGALGDLMLLAPAAAVLARRGVRLELSVQRSLAGFASAMFRGAPGPPIDGIAMSSLFKSEAALPLARWLRGADIVHAWFGSCGTEREIESQMRHLDVGRVRWHSVERGDGPLHASVAYAAALEVGGPLFPVAPALDGARQPLSWRCPPERRLVIHPGAGSPEKRWGSFGFRRVADGWRERGGEVAVLLGPAEEGVMDFWQATGHRVAAGLGILDAAALIASAPRYVGNDSGVSHVAGALARTGAVLFGPTRPERWRPLGGALAAVHFTACAEEPLAARLLRRLGAP